MTEKIDITWQDEFANNWKERVRQGRMPHAALLAGPAGVGKRAAATWMAARHLGLANIPDLPRYPVAAIEHADMRWVTPPEDKTAIGIDQIRELVAEMSLTSYEGGGKVAVIEPAEAMTNNAANSLLKTLEEPSGDALLLLVVDRKGKLPATIFSRCQRIDFSPPREAQALAWLDRVQPGAQWLEALRLAGNAPLGAIEALQRLDTHGSMSRDFAAVAGGKASALQVAARWKDLDTAFVLEWLARQVQAAILRLAGASRTGPPVAIDDSVLNRMDRRNLFCYLDMINRLRGQPGGSYNFQLTLEGLLIDLSEGLKTCEPAPPGGAAGDLRVPR